MEMHSKHTQFLLRCALALLATSLFSFGVILVPDIYSTFGGWIFSDWFGSLNVNFYPWIFHAQHQWMFAFDQSKPESVFLFDLGVGGWLFTSSGLYPNLFSFSRNSWIFYFLDTFAPREFVDLQTGEFFSW